MTLETEIEIGTDGSVKLLRPLPAWLKPGKARFRMTLERIEDPSEVQTPIATPEMVARRNAALEEIRRLDPFRDISEPVEWQKELRGDRSLPNRE